MLNDEECLSLVFQVTALPRDDEGMSLLCTGSQFEISDATLGLETGVVMKGRAARAVNHDGSNNLLS